MHKNHDKINKTNDKISNSKSKFENASGNEIQNVNLKKPQMQNGKREFKCLSNRVFVTKIFSKCNETPLQLESMKANSLSKGK